MTAAVTLRDLTLGYEGHPAVHHLSGSFAASSLTAVVGPNGSGKSTLLKGIVGALRPLGGAIEREDGDIAFLPQSAEIARDFPATVSDLVGLGFWKRRGSFSGLTAGDRDQLAASLAAVGLYGFENRPLDTLSGGQVQRALFARVLVQDASLVLLDEPFAAIDERTVADLMQLIERWHDEGRTIIAVLHELELVREHFPQTLLLARNPIAWGETSSVLTEDNLRRARSMPEAWDEHAPWHDEHAAQAAAEHVH
ncbi:MAG TPA: zinc ABC transporter ATP-binding protein AztA [Devosia sp.]|nr:zinc ABC transporter ATP-binding protein AztA [Devosia sp.]